MKETGVVRRIDDLGRIVIPKEIRRTLKINDGDNLEIYVTDDSIILKKYCFLNNSLIVAQKFADIFYKLYHKDILITDNDNVIAASKGLGYYINKPLSDDIIGLINKRNDCIKKCAIVNGSNNYNFYLYPLISSSDAFGSVIAISDDVNDLDKSIIKMISAFLVKNVEE